ncbi:FxSxx-COOH system tetratricopeptide repeat protein [Pseudonocardia eucalypti]|uniref:FxSxx-COOH system tetratricopeptide repeat protein n=1 Tax=Pseudonocardia eucalypti TaxID=648755 RepID=A0ABP9Q0E3_9PSEU|nr:hypothetical protein [Pseudonocardia eucalypti]
MQSAGAREPASEGADARNAQGVQVVLPGGSGVQHNYFAGRRPVSWPHLVGVIPPRADGYQHRAVFTVLADNFRVRRVPVQVIAGLGGVGKTQLAAELARRMRVEAALDLVVWVSVLSRAGVVSAYAQAATDLVLGPDSQDPDQAAVRFLSWLGSTGKSWLVVLDDVASAADMRALWPPEHPNGHTIVTTRRRDAELLAGRELVGVAEFTEREAIDYLVGKLPAGLTDDVGGVAADLGRLPLALGHAAAYMRDQELTCTAYRRRFADRRRRLSGLFPEESELFDHAAKTVATTWSLSVEAADRVAPTGVARPLLELASVLDSNGMPETLFATEAALGYAARGPAALNEDDARDGLRALHRFHLVAHDAGLVRVHALVQRAVREELPEQRLAAVAVSAADALACLWPDVDVDARFAQLLRANGVTLYRVVADQLWANASVAHPVLSRLVRGFGDAAMLSDAIAWARDIGDAAHRVLGAGHRDTMAFRNQLAMWLGDAGQVDEAIAELERLVAEVAATLGPDDPNTLDARQNLGYQRGHAGDPAAAASELAEVLVDCQRVLGPDDWRSLNLADQLAFWLGKSGDAAGAVALLRETLPRVVRTCGPEHRTTLSVRGNLAWWVAESGQVSEGVAALREVVADTVRVLGAEHRDVSVLRNNLAYWQGRSGDIAGAVAALEELLLERLRVFGPDHRDSHATRNGLAELYLESGDPAAAIAHLEVVLASRRQVFGDDHSETWDTRYRLACARGDLGETVQAVEELAAVLDARERLLGADHRETDRTRQSLAHWRAR